MNYIVFFSTFNTLTEYSGEKCIEPPIPPTESKMILANYNSNQPPSHGQAVIYICNAGPDHNKFQHDYNQWYLTATCLEGNTFSNVSWPTCINGKRTGREIVPSDDPRSCTDVNCSDPSAFNTNNITSFGYPAVINYGDYV